MAQILTEEQIEDRQELFLTILDDYITENFNIGEKYEMTEEDAYIFSIMQEHFEDNFRFPTRQESVWESVTGLDINHALYEEIAEQMMDESIGTFVAGAAHGIRNALSKRKADRATSSKEKSKSEFEKHVTNPGSKGVHKYKADAEQQALSAKKYASGVMGTAKKAFDQGRVTANKARAEKAKSTMKSAETARKSSVAKHQSNVAKTGALASKIDKGVENIKNKVKSAVTAGAAKVGGFLGKHFG